MNILNLTQINLSKLNQHKLKAMFLILPITILMILTIVVSSQVQNFKDASDASIFGTIQEQSTLINLTKTVDFSASGGNPGQFFNANNSQYTTDDLTKIQAISNVTAASLNSSVPVSNIKTTDLFSDETYTLNNLVELDPYSASLYTDEDFDYTVGDTVIPVILNANTFITQYEDWGDQTEISVTFTRGTAGARPTGTPGADPLANSGSPIKQKTLEYTKEDIIGQTFTVTVGGLNAIQDYTTTQDSGTIKFTKLTDEELASKTQEEKDAISKYWDYEKVSTPKTYTFKVVGIIESEGRNNSFIPASFASQMVKDVVQNQLDARNSTEISTDLLNSTYKGMTYDGTELSGGTSQFGNRGGMGGGFARPGETTSTSTTSYTIPGLVVQLSTDGQQTVEGIYSDSSVYDQAVKTGNSISIKINSVYDREQVVKDLNSAGFAYTDTNGLGIFDDLKNNLNNISFWFTVAFVILSGAVIIFAMSRFVADSKKEIGIFRAIGMKKGSIIVLFTSQAILYSAIGFVIGSVLGYLLNILSAGAMKSWFDNLVTATVKSTFNVVNPVDANIFQNISWTVIGYYSLALLVITFVIALIPAFQAASVSPVEAIRGE